MLPHFANELLGLMPETTFQTKPWRARARRMVLFLCTGGLVAALFVFGCRSGSDESGKEAASIYEQNTEVLLSIGVERGEDLPGSFDGLTIEVPGYDPWQTNLVYGGDTKAFGHFPVGEPRSFTIYPEGRDGTAIEVPFTMKKTMMSGTAQAKTYVTIHSDSIVAEGPAIPEGNATYAW